MAMLMDRPTLPTAVVAEYDELAIGAVRTLRRASIAVPGRLSVVGLDDHEMASVVDLTSVAQPVQEQGSVAARLLLDESLDGLAYDLSGPEALTFEQAAKLLGEARGRDLRFVDADPQEWVAATVAAGVPQDYAAFLGVLLGLVRDGDDAHLSDGVQQVLGREPRDFATWAASLRPAVA